MGFAQDLFFSLWVHRYIEMNSTICASNYIERDKSMPSHMIIECDSQKSKYRTKNTTSITQNRIKLTHGTNLTSSNKDHMKVNGSSIDIDISIHSIFKCIDL